MALLSLRFEMAKESIKNQLILYPKEGAERTLVTALPAPKKMVRGYRCLHHINPPSHLIDFLQVNEKLPHLPDLKASTAKNPPQTTGEAQGQKNSPDYDTGRETGSLLDHDTDVNKWLDARTDLDERSSNHDHEGAVPKSSRDKLSKQTGNELHQDGAPLETDSQIPTVVKLSSDVSRKNSQRLSAEEISKFFDNNEDSMKNWELPEGANGQNQGSVSAEANSDILCNFFRKVFPSKVGTRTSSEPH